MLKCSYITQTSDIRISMTGIELSTPSKKGACLASSRERKMGGRRKLSKEIRMEPSKS